MAIIYKNDDLAKWGTGKGAPLTSVEADLNIWQILQRVTAMEDNPIMPNQIDFIEVVGNQMTIHMTDYNVFGPFTLPTAAFRWTGAFQPTHDYKANDVLRARDALYLVVNDNTSGATFVQTTDYALMFDLPTKLSVAFFFPGSPGTGIELTGGTDPQAMFTYRADRDFFLPEDLTGSIGGLRLAATDAISLPILKNTTEIGTIDVAAAATACTFTFAAGVQFAANDLIRVLRPVDIDATAKDLSVTLQASLGTLV